MLESLHHGGDGGGHGRRRRGGGRERGGQEKRAERKPKKQKDKRRQKRGGCERWGLDLFAACQPHNQNHQHRHADNDERLRVLRNHAFWLGRFVLNRVWRVRNLLRIIRHCWCSVAASPHFFAKGWPARTASPAG